MKTNREKNNIISADDMYYLDTQAIITTSGDREKAEDHETYRMRHADPVSCTVLLPLHRLCSYVVCVCEDDARARATPTNIQTTQCCYFMCL